MSEKDTGAMDKAKGLAKEVVGKATGDETKEAEGRSERGKGSAEGDKGYFRDIIEKTNERSTSGAG